MSAPAKAPVKYSSIEEIIEQFGLDANNARLLLAKSEAAIKHGMSEPKGVADKEVRISWVQDGHDKIVRISPSWSRACQSH
jgi:hypothetical protein